MTDNDAAKAFNGCRTNTVLNGNMVVYYIPLQQEEKIRAALTKSAKVDEIQQEFDSWKKDHFSVLAENITVKAKADGLLEALKKVDKTLQIPAAEYVPAISDVFTIIDKAIQRFNGEV